jgi:DNA-directed RNA polymerase specialized sigma24 family protein
MNAIVHSPALNSHLQRLCQVAAKLPADLRRVYEAHILQGKSKQECCEELSITSEQFEHCMREVVRNIRAGVGASFNAVAEAAA